MFNLGEFRDRIFVLELKLNQSMYSWTNVRGLWSKVELLNGNNIFSKVGLGAKSIKFTIRKRDDISLFNAMNWYGKHCFITDIKPVDRMYYEVTAALIEPTICIIEKESEQTLDELNRPVYGESIQITFPGYLTEKYLGHTQGEPMAQVETIFVLVTPKPIVMESSELVTICNKRYTVLVAHTLDEFKNEYEILFKEDT
ncbi:MAG: hypothetical protein K0R00_3229 [Herbinix sp.]|jgi:hypothetical protein|nr:hypothetical protein [Herbinix sp.]